MFREPFGEGNRVAVKIALILDVEDRESRKFDEGFSDAKKFLGGAVGSDGRRGRLWNHGRDNQSDGMVVQIIQISSADCERRA